MKTDCNYEPPNVPCKNLQGKLLPKLLAFSTSTFPTVQTHVKLSNLRDLRPATLKQKIPRPPNAFMLFANDFRRKLAGEFPKESNKDISVRLGCMWKNMEKDTKERYFQIAKEVDAAHKRKYPDYVYNPKEARLRKALREKSRGERQGGPASSGQRGGAPASWSKPRQNMNPRQPICVQMVGDQQQLSHRQLHQQQFRQLQQQPVSLLRGNKQTDTAATMMLQNYNDYLDFPYHHVAQAADYTLLPEHHQSDSWYSSTFLQQGPEHNATSTSYAMRSEAGKVAESNEWSSHFNTENNAAFIHSNSENTAEKDGTSRSEQYIDSGREQATVNGGPHHHPQHSQQQCMSVQSSAEQDNNAPVPVSDIETENGVLLEPNLMETKTLLTLSQPSHGKLQSAAEVKSNGGNTSKDGLRLPGFHQAFGSTEIGRFSQHEEFFEAQPLPQPQDTKVSASNTTQQQSQTGKRARNPRGPRKNKVKEEKGSRSWQPPERDSWPQESDTLQPAVGNRSSGFGYQYPHPHQQVHQDEQNYGSSQHWSMASRPNQQDCYYPHSHANTQPPYYQPQPYYGSVPQPQQLEGPMDASRNSNYYSSPASYRSHPYYHPSHYPHQHQHQHPHPNHSYYNQHHNHSHNHNPPHHPHYDYYNSGYSTRLECDSNAPYSSGLGHPSQQHLHGGWPSAQARQGYPPV